MSMSLFLLCKYVHLYHFLSFRVQVMSSVTLVSVWPGVIMSRSISVAEVPFCKVNKLGFLKLELCWLYPCVSVNWGLCLGPGELMHACILMVNLPQHFEKGAASLPSEPDIPVLKSPLLTLHLWGSAWYPQPLLPYLVILLPTSPLLFRNVPGGLSPRSFGPALSSTWTSFPAEGHVASPCVSLCPYWNVTYRMRAFLTTVHGTLSRCTWITWEFTSLSWFTLLHGMHHHGVWWT